METNEQYRIAAMLQELETFTTEYEKDAIRTVSVDIFEYFILPEFIRNPDGTWPVPDEFLRFNKGAAMSPMRIVDRSNNFLFFCPPPINEVTCIPANFRTHDFLGLAELLDTAENVRLSQGAAAAEALLYNQGGRFMRQVGINSDVQNANRRYLVEIFLRYPNRLDLKHIFGDDFVLPKDFKNPYVTDDKATSTARSLVSGSDSGDEEELSFD